MANFNEKINSHKEFVLRDSEHDYFIKRIGSMTLLKLEFGYNVNYLKSEYRLFIQYKDTCRVKKLAGRCFVWACTPNTRGISDIQRFCLDLDVDEDIDNAGNPIFDYIAGAVLISEKGVLTYGDTWFETFDLEKNYVSCNAYVCGRMASGFRIPTEVFDRIFGLKENFPELCEKQVEEKNDLVEEAKRNIESCMNLLDTHERQLERAMDVIKLALVDIEDQKYELGVMLDKLTQKEEQKEERR